MLRRVWPPRWLLLREGVLHFLECSFCTFYSIVLLQTKGPTLGSVCMRDTSLNRATPAAGGREACHWSSGGQAGGFPSLACPKGMPPPVGA